MFKWVCYYLWLFLTVLTIMAFNFYFSGTYASHQCSVPKSRLLQGHKEQQHLAGWEPSQVQLGKQGPDIHHETASFTNGVTFTELETHQLRQLQSNTTTTAHPMTTVPKFMGFIYSGMLGMIAIYGLLFFNFLGKEERDPNLLGEGSGCCAKMYSLIIRVFPILMKLGHYGVLILIIVQVTTVFFGSDCESPFFVDTFGLKKSSPIVQLAQWGLAISGWFWIMIHIIFPGWRKLLHPVFFQYEPDDPSRNPIWAFLFIYWGPN